MSPRQIFFVMPGLLKELRSYSEFYVQKWASPITSSSPEVAKISTPLPFSFLRCGGGGVIGCGGEGGMGVLLFELPQQVSPSGWGCR